MKILGLLLLVSLNIYAGTETGNGGDAIVCRSNGKITQVLFYDLFEAKERRGIAPQDMGDPTNSFQDKVEMLLDRIAKYDESRANKYREFWKVFLDPTVTHFSHNILNDIPDAGDTIIPQGCVLEQIAQFRPQTFPDEKLYYIRSDLWDKMDNDNKAFLVMHEFIYRELRFGNDGLTHTNSVRARYFNSSLTALGEDFSRQQYVEALVYSHFRYYNIEKDFSFKLNAFTRMADGAEIKNCPMNGGFGNPIECQTTSYMPIFHDNGEIKKGALELTNRLDENKRYKIRNYEIVIWDTKSFSIEFDDTFNFKEISFDIRRDRITIINSKAELQYSGVGKMFFEEGKLTQITFSYFDFDFENIYYKDYTKEEKDVFVNENGTLRGTFVMDSSGSSDHWFLFDERKIEKPRISLAMTLDDQGKVSKVCTHFEKSINQRCFDNPEDYFSFNSQLEKDLNETSFTSTYKKEKDARAQVKKLCEKNKNIFIERYPFSNYLKEDNYCSDMACYKMGSTFSNKWECYKKITLKKDPNNFNLIK